MAKRHLLQDLFILSVSLLLAWAIVHYALVQTMLGFLGGSDILASFIAGIFFTSITTTAPDSAPRTVLPSRVTHPTATSPTASIADFFGLYP